MNKYLKVFLTSISQEFTYKLNFIMWRLRNVLQIVVFYSLWNAVFINNNSTFFNYSKDKIITYVFLLIFIRAIVLSTRSIDVAGIISNGDILNLLLKPINFIKYWLTRDFASKVLNFSFSIIEIVILYVIFKPNIFIQTNFINITLFIISLLLACVIYFSIVMMTSFVPFWIPEISWGAQFLVIVTFVEFLSGAFFPLDVLPKQILTLVNILPFPHLIFTPIKMYLHTEPMSNLLLSLFLSFVWSLVLFKLTTIVWKKGLKAYEAVGK